MNAPQRNATQIQSIQNKAGFALFAVLAFALIGSIVHDLGAAPMQSARADVVVGSAA